MGRQAGCQIVEHDGCGDARSAQTGLAVTHVRIDGDVPAPVHAESLLIGDLNAAHSVRFGPVQTRVNGTMLMSRMHPWHVLLLARVRVPRRRCRVTLKVGRLVWLPCEVKPGPFSDERFIRVSSERGDWFAFVPVDSLRDPVENGESSVRAVLVDVHGERFRARVAGEPVTSSFFEGTLSRVPLAALQA